MTQVTMTTDAVTLTMQLFPLSPDAVRRLRASDDIVSIRAMPPSKDN